MINLTKTKTVLVNVTDVKNYTRELDSKYLNEVRTKKLAEVDSPFEFAMKMTNKNKATYYLTGWYFDSVEQFLSRYYNERELEVYMNVLIESR